MSEREQYSNQIDRLTGSHTLHGSESLCKLLRYLAVQALDNPSAPLKEYQIATEVFARRADFDPQLDSTIRVQAGRLRSKLAEYYAAEGADDSVVVDLPKGTYHLQFHQRHSGNGKHPSAAAVEQPAARSAEFRPTARAWKTIAMVLGVLLLLAISVIGVLLGNSRGASPVLAVEQVSAPAEFRTFWKPFLTAEQEPWLIFSNAAFVGRPEIGMRYYNPTRDSTGLIWDHYTGVGEVLAVHELDQMFDALRRQIRVKRGSLFSLDDVRNNDLIFLGSPSENLTLGEIPSTRQFVFQRLSSGPRSGDLAILNLKPLAGEPASFLASPYTSPLIEDYAVIGLMPGLNPSRSVMILAGTTTFGTQGAVEYVCGQNSLRELFSKLPKPENGVMQPFEALLHVKIAHGVPVETDLVSVRQRTESP
jgi:hypothetical protein